MARPKDGTFRQLCREIDPRKVADIIDGYELGAARRRWHWATACILALAEEGRRMKAAGETWKRARRPAEADEVEVQPAQPTRPVPVPRLVERPSAPIPATLAPAIVQTEADRVANLHRRLARQAATIAELTPGSRGWRPGSRRRRPGSSRSTRLPPPRPGTSRSSPRPCCGCCGACQSAWSP